jgi:hypothetical protein
LIVGKRLLCISSATVLPPISHALRTTIDKWIQGTTSYSSGRPFEHMLPASGCLLYLRMRKWRFSVFDTYGLVINVWYTERKGPPGVGTLC